MEGGRGVGRRGEGRGGLKRPEEAFFEPGDGEGGAYCAGCWCIKHNAFFLLLLGEEERGKERKEGGL